MEVPRENTTRVIDLIVFRISGDYGTVTGEGLRPSVPWTQGRRGVGRKWGLLSVEGGAAHSNTQGEWGQVIEIVSSQGKGTKGKGDGNGTKETEDVTWSPRDLQVLLKYQRNRRVTLKGTEA